MTGVTSPGKTHPLPSCVAVTGAGGFIGGRIAELLTYQRGVDEVRKFSRRSEPKRHIQYIQLDNGSDVQRALIGCGAVVHCAFNMYDMESNIRIANVLGRACAAAGIRLVHISTAAVYEPLPDGYLNEQSPVQRTNPYSATKAAIEELLLGFSGSLGLDVIILQPTVVYGPSGRAWTDSPVRELLFGSVVLPNEGKGFCNAVFVDDVAQAAINAIKTDIPAGERLLISGAAPVEWGEFFQRYAKMIGRCDLVLHAKSAAVGNNGDAKPRLVIRDRVIDRIKALLIGRLSGNIRGRLNMGFRRLRSAMGKNTAELPTGTTFALYSSRCHIQIDKARSLLGYSPEFDLYRGMAITEGYVRRKYSKQIASRDRA